MKSHAVITKTLYTMLGIFACVSVAQAQITVTEAQIGCIDKPQSRNVGNLTTIVGNACNGKFSCSFKAPDPAEYTAEGVHPYTRNFCTQAMEITYQCVGGRGGSVEVPGDAWKNPAAQLFCEPQAPPQSNTTGTQNPLVPVLQGLLQKYKKCIVEQYESPTPPNPALGPLRDSATCVDGNTCTIASRLATFQKLQIQASRGDATNFETMLHSAILNDCFQCGTHAELHTKQMHCTWDCGGNQSWYSDPLHFNAGIGPCFETCKAGVDITKLVNDIINDIHGVLQGVGLVGNQDPANATGGPTVATNRTTVDPTSVLEKCDARPIGYFIAPPELLDWTPSDAPKFKNVLTNYDPEESPTRAQYNPGALSSNSVTSKLNIGANEGRLRGDLREAAARRNPLESLCKSAAAFAAGNVSDGNAFADLSVTGRHSFAAFRAQPPQEAQIVSCLRNNPSTKGLPEAKLQDAASKALDRAYRVLHIVRTGGWPGNPDSPAPGTRDVPACLQERASLGYIAVSGEDDQPHRPVNGPSAEFPQYDLDVPVVVRTTHRTITVHTRYMIAHTNQPQADQLGSCAFTGRTIPADRTPVLAPDAEIFLYIHGMDSRLEEALDLTHALHTLGHQRNKNYTVISMDLPTSGYADNLDYNLIAPLTADGHAGGGFNLVDGLTFAPNKYVVPIVDFIEDFIVSFVNTLDKPDHLPGLTRHPIYPIGGSLGGHMAFRLGRPRADAPWITTVVPWSPAAIWPSFADNGSQHAALAASWYLAGGDPTIAPETPGARRSFFYGGFDWASKIAFFYEPSGGGKPQAEFWYRDKWDCKPAHVHLARIDRYETYDHNFRLWHWRLGMEQLIFSQQEPAGTPPQPLYLSNTKRMLLLCGMQDVGGNLCQETRNVAPKMEMTPGKALYLTETGHSIHNERPNFLASQILDFVDGPARAQAVPLLQARVCPTADGRTCSAPPTVSKTQEATVLLKAIVTVTGNGQPVAGATVAVPGSASAVTDSHGTAVVTYHLFAQKSVPEGGNDPRGKPRSFVASGSTTTFIAPVASISKAGYQSASVDLPDPSVKP